MIGGQSMSNKMKYNYFKLNSKEKKIFKNVYNRLKYAFVIPMIITSVFIGVFKFQSEIDKLKVDQLKLAIDVEQFKNKEFNYLLQQSFNLARMYTNRLYDEYDELTIISEWKNYIIYENTIDQIRLLDNDGQEIIRINDNNNKPLIVGRDELQSKSGRGYYLAAKDIENNQQLITEIDLNMENGIIEYRGDEGYVATIRVVTPIVKQDVRSGYLVVNYNLNRFLDNLRDLSDDEDVKVYLVNHDGYFLNHEDPSLNFNFMFDDGQDINLQNRQPELAEHLGDFRTSHEVSDGFFTQLKFGLHSLNEQKQFVVLGEEGANDYLFIVTRKDSKRGYFIHWNLFKGFISTLNFQIILIVITAVFNYLLILFVFGYERNVQKYKTEADKDQLTNVLSRRRCLKLLEELTLRRNIKLNYAIAFIDVNGLKQVNDVLGHDEGDALLISFTDLFKRTSRFNDKLGRLGGDEFLVIVDDSDAKSLKMKMIKFEKEIAEFNQSTNNKFLLSISYGIFDRIQFGEQFNREVTKDNVNEFIEELLKEADSKMYEMKVLVKSDGFTSLK